MHRALNLRDDIDRLYVWEKKEEEDIEDSVDASIRDHIKKSKEGLITVTNNKEGLITITNNKEGLITVTNNKEGLITVTNKKEGLITVTNNKEGLITVTNNKEGLITITNNKEGLIIVTNNKEVLITVTNNRKWQYKDNKITITRKLNNFMDISNDKLVKSHQRRPGHSYERENLRGLLNVF